MGVTQYLPNKVEATAFSPGYFKEKIGQELGIGTQEVIKFLEKFGFDDKSYWFIFQQSGKSGFFARQCASLDEGASMENATATFFLETDNENQPYQIHVAGANKRKKVINSASYKINGSGDFQLDSFDIVLNQKEIPKSLKDCEAVANTNPSYPLEHFSGYLTNKMTDSVALKNPKRLCFHNLGPGGLINNIALLTHSMRYFEQGKGFTYSELNNSATVQFGKISRSLPLKLRKSK